jgi:hypothetical protein
MVRVDVKVKDDKYFGMKGVEHNIFSTRNLIILKEFFLVQKIEFFLWRWGRASPPRTIFTISSWLMNHENLDGFVP